MRTASVDFAAKRMIHRIHRINAGNELERNIRIIPVIIFQILSLFKLKKE